MRRPLLASLCAALAIGALATGPTTTAEAASTADLKVGSFNISGVTFDTSASGDHEVWKKRRATVADQIVRSGLDVVGVQEANPAGVYASRLVRGPNQFMDLKYALNERGGNYALTNEYAYNCVRHTSSSNCTYQYRGSALDNRIYYDTDTTSLVRAGSMKFSAQSAGKYDRYLAWAVLKNKATGKTFLFTNTHLDPYSNTNKIKQWRQAIAKTNSLKGSMPVIAVGDYNTTKWTYYAQQMLPETKRAGFGDVLNQEYRVNPVRTKRAQSTTNAYVNSFNGYRRSVGSYCYCSAKSKYGNNIDWIFADNRMPVKNWSVVMNWDARAQRLTGTIPSDHSLVTATLTLR